MEMCITPHSLNLHAKFAVLFYNHLRSRRILARPTVVQSETIISLKNKRITVVILSGDFKDCINLDTQYGLRTII